MGDLGRTKLLAAGALMILALAPSLASAAVISTASGDILSDSGAYLGTANGTLGTPYITYGINLPTTTACAGDFSGCVEPFDISGGYTGTGDVTFSQTLSTQTGSLGLNLTWATTNGNTSPLNDLIGILNGNANQNLTSLLGNVGPYDLGGGRSWDGTFPFIGVGTDNADTSFLLDGPDTVYLYFDTPIAGFSALFNYNSAWGSTPTITSYDAFGNVMESTMLSSSAAGANTGYLAGFLDASPDISIIGLTDAYAVMANLSITLGETAPTEPTQAVPEPMSLALLGAGLAGLGFVRRKMIKS